MAKLFTKVGIKIKGAPQLLRKLDKYADNLEKHFEKGLTKAGTWLLRESKKIVPVDTNALRSSGAATKQGKGFNTTIIVSYGPLSYALYVHEDLNARHAKGKSAKFLEIPFRQGLTIMKNIVLKECQKGQTTRAYPSESFT